MNYIEYTFAVENTMLIALFIGCLVQVLSVLLEHKINNAKLLKKCRIIVLIVQVIFAVMIVIPKNNSKELHIIYSSYGANIQDILANDITKNNETILQGIKDSYGNDFDYLKDTTYTFDDILYNGELIDLSFGSYIQNLINFDTNKVIRFKDININKHTDKLVLKSKKVNGENLELSGNTVSGNFYIFAGQPLINDGQLDEYIPVLITELTLVYDTYSPPSGGQNIMSNYKVLEVKTTSPVTNKATSSELK